MSLFDLSSFLGVLAGDTATHERYSVTYDSNGKLTDPALLFSNTIQVSFQPNGRKLSAGPEGEQATQDFWTVFAPVELVVGDTIRVGDRYQVVSVESWNAIGGFCEATAQRFADSEA